MLPQFSSALVIAIIVRYFVQSFVRNAVRGEYFEQRLLVLFRFLAARTPIRPGRGYAAERGPEYFLRYAERGGDQDNRPAMIDRVRLIAACDLYRVFANGCRADVVACQSCCPAGSGFPRTGRPVCTCRSPPGRRRQCRTCRGFRWLRRLRLACPARPRYACHEKDACQCHREHD